MGCGNSKEKRCSNCISHYSPVPRTNSIHVLHPPQTKEDSYHVVALKSTTLGSLDEVSHQNYDSNGFIKFPNGNRVSYSDFFRSQNHDLKKDYSIDVVEESKAWSNMIEKKLPKAIVVPITPTITPPCEPETINTWELMEGLEDTSPLRSPIHFKSFSFDVNYDHVVEVVDPHRCSFIENGTSSNKPFCIQGESRLNLKPAVSDFDDDLVSSLFRKALEEKRGSLDVTGLSFEEKKINGNVDDDDDVDAVMDFKACRKEKDKVVLYFTTLRGVRKTYEDCYHVRMILKGLGVKVDERDVSMHSVFKEELKELLGDDGFGKGRLLPRVFVGRNCIGGADEIQKMHEDGKLDKLFDCCEKIDDNDSTLCEACCDIRFLPCETCNGSCKIYYEDKESEDGEEKEAEDGEVGEYGFQRCPDCNENGLIRCPICCY